MRVCVWVIEFSRSCVWQDTRPVTSFIAHSSSLQNRKPYTLTKQREKWTDDEHQRFVEALRIHGRQWRKIEEHVKTKTSVQIRSHAQKFFSKIEKQQQAIRMGMAPPQCKYLFRF